MISLTKPRNKSFHLALARRTRHTGKLLVVFTEDFHVTLTKRTCHTGKLPVAFTNDFRATLARRTRHTGKLPAACTNYNHVILAVQTPYFELESLGQQTSNSDFLQRPPTTSGT